jgi:hypothetical protein
VQYRTEKKWCLSFKLCLVHLKYEIL